jgi:hypothetical protein
LIRPVRSRTAPGATSTAAVVVIVIREDKSYSQDKGGGRKRRQEKGKAQRRERDDLHRQAHGLAFGRIRHGDLILARIRLGLDMAGIRDDNVGVRFLFPTHATIYRLDKHG